MKSLRSMVVDTLVILPLVFLFSFASPAQSTKPPEKTPTTSRRAERELKARKEWQKQIAKVPVPKKGCFTANYPDKQWKEVPCGAPSKYPNTVGGTIGNDVGPNVSPLFISSAQGSFDSVSPSTITETGPWNGNATAANAFSIQMNTQFFATTVCAGHAGCQGWQQFIYSQNQCGGPCVFMEYWLIGFGVAVPVGLLDPVRKQLFLQQRELTCSYDHCGATAKHDFNRDSPRRHGYSCPDFAWRRGDRNGRGHCPECVERLEYRRFHRVR